MMLIPVVAVASGLFILLTIWVSLTAPAAFDRDVLDYFASYRSDTASDVFLHLTRAGSIFFLAPASLVIGVVLVARQQRAGAGYLVTSLTVAAIAARLLKYLIARERPDIYPAMVETYTELAFPSVHAAQVSAFSLALFLVIIRWRLAWRVIAGLVLLVITFGVMCSRLYLQVHYPSDVIGGVLLGIICAVGCEIWMRKPAK
jgi:undecaprenyl-diphosphatase